MTKRNKKNVKSVQQVELEAIDIAAARIVASKAVQLPTIEAGGFIENAEAFKVNMPKTKFVEEKENIENE